jgi:hypothetical protein
MQRRLDSISDSRWVDAIVAMLLKAHDKANPTKNRVGEYISQGWHRWHDSGDLQSIEHLAKICEVARRTPKIKHWLPTRELKIVRAYVDSGNMIPRNLVIRVSATMVDGQPTQHWPNTSTVHHDAAPQGRACPAPKQGNQCGSCRACWNPKVSNVSYHKH